MAIHAVMEVYDFSPFSTIVDVAGGHGYVICEILRQYPNLKGILFDLDDVVGGGEHRICQLALDGRCRTVAGDFFNSVPDGGDLYLMKNHPRLGGGSRARHSAELSRGIARQAQGQAGPDRIRHTPRKPAAHVENH
jgi:hypothetical protein